MSSVASLAGRVAPVAASGARSRDLPRRGPRAPPPEQVRSRRPPPVSIAGALATVLPGAARAYTEEDSLGLWRPPDGSNPLEGLFAGPSPIPGIDGSLTGVWFGDLFAYMNLVLILGLLVVSSKPIEDDGRGGSTGEGMMGGARAGKEDPEKDGEK